jgi:hypothetical protein
VINPRNHFDIVWNNEIEMVLECVVF